MSSQPLSVVVTGNMNPAIHHPLWYVAGGSLSEADAKSAIDSGASVTVPQFATFSTARWKIECLPDRWAIFALSPTSITEVLEITCRTFERLDETPVNSFGLNFENRGMPAQGAAPFDVFLSTLNLEEYAIRQVSLGRSLPPLTIENSMLNRSLNVVLDVRPGEPIILRSNVHHDIRSLAGFHFSLTKQLRAAHDDALTLIRALVSTFFGGTEV